MIFVEPKINSIIINQIDFSISRNYIPEFVLALRELDPRKTIHFVVDLDNTPVMFIVYFRKLKETNPDLDLELYFRDQGDILKKVINQYNLTYNDITDYAYPLPHENNIVEIIDPFKDIEDPESWLPMTSSTED